MPYRKTPLISGEIYHVFNRSVARQPIFVSRREYQRVMELINFYRFAKQPMKYSRFNHLPLDQKELFIEMNMRKKKPMLDIFAYCVMPNHFHFLLRPSSDQAISDFMRNLQNSY